LRDEIAMAVKGDSDVGDLIADVYRKESLYSGPEVGSIPDLFVDFKKCCTSSQKTPKGEFVGKRQDSGYHTMDGIIIAAGPDIKKGEVDGANITDITPTVLSFFGIGHEDVLDGKVLPIFKNANSARAHQRAAGSGGGDEVRSTQKSESKDEEVIKGRLRTLGYLE